MTRIAIPSLALALSLSLTPLIAQDKLETSFSAPGNLPLESVPLFVVLGFDDNRYAEGMEWVLNLLEGKKNPKGTGNPATFDDMPISASFYYISNALETGGEKLLKQWKRSADAGYEVGCHTITHEMPNNAGDAGWVADITGCRATLSQKLGVPEADIVGLRIPYLKVNASAYNAMEKTKLLYDCSLTHQQDYNKKQFPWPYTLDKDITTLVLTPSGGLKGKCTHPGLWMLPVYPVNEDPTTLWPPLTGFDSTILPLNGAKLETMWKAGLDYRLQASGNRAPMTVGLHTDYYTNENPSAKQLDSYLSLEKRRASLENFIQYALQKPCVRFVSAKQLIAWMKKPVPLGTTPEHPAVE